MSAPGRPAIGGAARQVEMLGAKRPNSAQRDGGVPFVSVIIPARNAEQHIGRCLDSVLGQDYPPERMEILVLDGMSTDATPEVVRRYAGEDTRVKLLENPERIVPTALNRGIEASQGEVILRLDAHAWMAPNYISKCVEWLQRTGADNVGGAMRAVGTGPLGRAIALAHQVWFGLGGAAFHNEWASGFVDTVYLGAWPRDVFERVGLFDERLVRNQDIEFNARIRRAGGRVYLAHDIVVHYACRERLRDLWRQNFANGYWNIFTASRAPGTLSLRHFAPLIAIVGFSLSCLGATLWLPAIWLALGMMVAYAAMAALATVNVLLQHPSASALLLPVVLVSLHAAYGVGSVTGGFAWLLKRGAFCAEQEQARA